ncbi:SDR family oxidoreductase [Tabrizicola sp. J26]|uniref:SDR family oxidoreductase n=1 Tax=Alitabrizicola rongguiensis TaxID=2909234 RepID=UPI001F162F38|nr:SDR family oxidoreductase [Tabrizicola rongguiensis]MCF1707596.1 SDR family oxidoreductase [Tabrizicola rongguiensis]
MAIREQGAVLITGATGGMGRPLCARLAAEGRELILAARTRSDLRSLCDTLEAEYPGPFHAVPLDMADISSVERFGAALTDLDVPLQGAVLMPPQPARSNDPLPPVEAWNQLFAASFIGPLEVLKQALPHMKSDPATSLRAKIVIVSGISSAQVLGHYATGNVLRTAWLAEAKVLAFALGPRGIHVNTVSFGGALTPHYLELIQQRASANGVTVAEQIGAETDNVPLRKYGTPEEAAATIAMLLSPVSDHLTGINLLQDGGFTRAY